MESLYDYGARSGFWRLQRLLNDVPVTVFAVGMALERNPQVCAFLKAHSLWEVASHGYRWVDYQHIDEETERDHIARTVDIHERLLGKRPVGIYQGKVTDRILDFYSVLNDESFFLNNLPMKPISPM
jgi:allantoinase